MLVGVLAFVLAEGAAEDPLGELSRVTFGAVGEVLCHADHEAIVPHGEGLNGS